MTARLRELAERVLDGPTKEDVDRAARYIFGDATERDAQAVANALADYHRMVLAAAPQPGEWA